MAQNNASEQDKKVPDIGNCRVRKLDNGWLICMMKPNCSYALPFGNICSHPQANRIPVESS